MAKKVPEIGTFNIIDSLLNGRMDKKFKSAIKCLKRQLGPITK